MIDSRKSAGPTSPDKDADGIGHPKACVVMSSSRSYSFDYSEFYYLAGQPDSEAAGSIPQPTQDHHLRIVPTGSNDDRVRSALVV